MVVSQCYFCVMQSLKTLWNSVTLKPVTGHLASFTVYTRYFCLSLFKLSFFGEHDSEKKAELTWCFKYLISELTPERQLKQCLYPEGTFLTVNIKKPAWGSVRRKRPTCEGVSVEGVAPCLVLGCSHFLPAPSQCLPCSCFIHSGFHSAELSPGYHPQQLAKCRLNSLPASLGVAAEHLALPAMANSEALEAVTLFERNICLWDSEWDTGVTVTALLLPRQRKYLCKHNLSGRAPCSTPWVTASSWLCSSELFIPFCFRVSQLGSVLDTPLGLVTLETDHLGIGGGTTVQLHGFIISFYFMWVASDQDPSSCLALLSACFPVADLPRPDGCYQR